MSQYTDDLDRKTALEHKKLVPALANLLEWAKGERGSKDINPYCVPEVKEALKVLAEIYHLDPKDYLNVPTKEISEQYQRFNPPAGVR